ncbi:putative membrane protein [Corynebacterium aurimucosum ATCC 700975]|uniref:Putative membrane protein n=1 Tax=Corynebacterium aurimucosum (strain ATCC 700975 / DSM 44827 / CIP 107346 / CN-1) TaxID=548476 RepID=C3PIS2_CORA7|nr:putative membrane protein [Corynebacterium aurimucosum ATCC 700975]
MKKSLAIISATALALSATPTAIADEGGAQTSQQSSSLSPSEFGVDHPFFGVIAIPVMLSSFALSMLGIPQCGLHDTTGC